MESLSFYASGSKTVYGENATYITSRNTSAGLIASNYDIRVGRQYLSGTYKTYRAFLSFDTTMNPGFDVQYATLTIRFLTNWMSGANYNIQIVKQDWSSQDPITAGNREAVYDACLSGSQDSSIWGNVANLTYNTNHTSNPLSGAWINKFGKTYYSLRSSYDYTPRGVLDPPTGLEYTSLVLGDSTPSPDFNETPYRPILTVYYINRFSIYIPLLYYNLPKDNPQLAYDYVPDVSGSQSYQNPGVLDVYFSNTSSSLTTLSNQLASMSGCFVGTGASGLNPGTSSSGLISGSTLAWSNYGRQHVNVTINGSAPLITGDWGYARIPQYLDGWVLTNTQAICGIASASGSITINVSRASASSNTYVEFLTRPIKIDEGEWDSRTGSATRVIDTTACKVYAGDRVRAIVTAPGTGTRYVQAQLVLKQFPG